MAAILMFLGRSLWQRPLRTLLTLFGIILGVGVILATSITNQSTIDSIESLFSEASGKADLIILKTNVGDPDIDEQLQRRLARIDGVAALAPSIHIQTLLADEGSDAQLEIGLVAASSAGLLLYGIDPALDEAARVYKLQNGRFLQNGRSSYEVVLVDEYAAEKNLQVGQTMQILTPNGVESLNIVGLIGKDGPGQLNNGAFGVLPLATAQEIYGRFGTLDQIDVVAAPGVETSSLQARLQAELGNDYTVIYPASQGRRVAQMLDTYQQGLSFFGTIALFVGSFLIYNAFSMTVVERTREIGMLRTLGMTRQQVRLQVLAEAIFLAILGSGLGVVVGTFLARGLIQATNLVLVQEINRISIPLDGLLTSLLVGIVVTFVSALPPAWQASQISPLLALRVRGNQQEGWIVQRGFPWGVAALLLGLFVLVAPLPGISALDTTQIGIILTFGGGILIIPKTADLWHKLFRPVVVALFGNEGGLGSGNVQRAKFRTMLTVSALMVGVAMIISINGLTTSFTHDINNWVNSYVGGELYVYSPLPMRADLLRRLQAVEGVAAVSPVRYSDVQYKRDDGTAELMTLMAVDPELYQQVNGITFESSAVDEAQLIAELQAGNTLFLSSVLAERYDVAVGDILSLETRRGVQQFRVAAIIIDFYNQGQVALGSWDDMRRYFGINDVNIFFVEVAAGASTTAVRSRIDTLYSERRNLNVESNAELRNRVLNLTSQTFALFDVLASMSTIVAAFGIVNTLTMSVNERIRELGALRSLGMTRWQVIKMILAEAGLLGMMGAIFGLAFGLVLSRLFMIGTQETQGYSLTYFFPFTGMVVGLIVSLVVSQASAILPARRATNLRIVEAIQYE